jgi:hypothetical protein
MVSCKASYTAAVLPELCVHRLPVSRASNWELGADRLVLQCSAVQCSAVQCSAVQCSALQWEVEGIAPFPTLSLQHDPGEPLSGGTYRAQYPHTAQHIALHCTVSTHCTTYCTALHSIHTLHTILHYTAQYPHTAHHIALHCTVSTHCTTYCTALHSIHTLYTILHSKMSEGRGEAFEVFTLILWICGEMLGLKRTAHCYQN